MASRYWRRAVPATLVVALFLSVSCGPQTSEQGGTAVGNRITMVTSYRFEPATLQVTSGTTVTWTNNDSYTHSVRFTKGINFQSQPLRPGESTSYLFSTPGEYEYECGLHPQAMKGKVIVLAPSSTGY